MFKYHIYNLRSCIKAIKILLIFVLIVNNLFFINEVLCQESFNQEDLKYGLKEEALSSKKILILVGKTPITSSDLEEYLSYRPLSPPSSITKESIKQRLDEMITSEALYQEALRQNIHQDPKIKRIIHQILTQKLLEEQVERRNRDNPIEEKDLKEYYNKFQYQFNRLEQVRLADIFIAIDQDVNPEHKSEKRKKAESILAEALEKGRGKRSHFGRLIIKHSDNHPKYPLGDTGFFDYEGEPLGLSHKLAKAAFDLKEIGDICDHVIETETGYHIIMLVEKRPAFYKSFEDMKDQIEQRIRREKLEETRNAYIERIKENTNIQIKEQAITDFFMKMKEEVQKKSQKENQKGPLPFHINAPPTFPGQDH